MIKVELTKEEIEMIIFGMTSTIYPFGLQKQAFELVLRLRGLSEKEK